MVEVSNHNDCVLNREPDQLIFRNLTMLTPVADFDPWEAVILDNVCDSILRRRVCNSPNHGDNSDVGQDNCVALSFREKNRVG